MTASTTEQVRAEERLALMYAGQMLYSPKNPHYLDLLQPPGKMAPCHRENVVQFINEICEDFGLRTQTAGLAVSYFDRYMSAVCTQVRMDSHKVQKLAIVVTLIASKFAEVKMPGIDDLCDMAQNKYKKAELKAQEMDILNQLGWHVHAITPHAVLEQLVVILGLERHAEGAKCVIQHAEFFIDMSYYEYHIVGFPPLVVAAASLLCGWAHLGAEKTEIDHVPILCRLCHVSPDMMYRCKGILEEYFETAFPQTAEERNCVSPDSVMQSLQPPSASQPPYCFSPVK
jgi:hypothetical protein